MATQCDERAWLKILTIAAALTKADHRRDVYLVTSSASRALIEITLSKTAMSVSIGVAISPLVPPLTTPYNRNRP